MNDVAPSKLMGTNLRLSKATLHDTQQFVKPTLCLTLILTYQQYLDSIFFYEFFCIWVITNEFLPRLALGNALYHFEELHPQFTQLPQGHKILPSSIIFRPRFTTQYKIRVQNLTKSKINAFQDFFFPLT